MVPQLLASEPPVPESRGLHVPALQIRLPLQVPPTQQFWPMAPHTTPESGGPQTPALHDMPPVHDPPVQQICPAPPHITPVSIGTPESMGPQVPALQTRLPKQGV